MVKKYLRYLIVIGLFVISLLAPASFRLVQSASAASIDGGQTCAQIQANDPEVKCVSSCSDGTNSCSGDCKTSSSDSSASQSCGVDCTGVYANSSNSKDCGIVQRYINPAINFISVVIGIVVVIMIIVGGIQYASAGGDPQRVAAAKKRIFNAIFALVAFGVLYGVLNFLIPGGL